jgi:ribonuclease BN (tRNA processing enzyme)
MKIAGFSTALYSTWLHVPRYRLLIDAGDGAAAHLGPICKTIDRIAITHEHRDHVAGLLEVLSWSALKRPCRIIYPAGSEVVDGIRQSAQRQGVPCAAEAEWMPMQPGQAVTLGMRREDHNEGTKVRRHEGIQYRECERAARQQRRNQERGVADRAPATVDLVAFSVPHAVAGHTDRSLGYAVLERAPATKDRVEQSRVVLAVTGDCLADPLDWPGRPDVLIRDCTYLRREDVHPSTGGLSQHGLLDDVLELTAASPPGHLMLYHLHERYSPAQARPWIETACRKLGLSFPVSVLWPGAYCADLLAAPVWTPPDAASASINPGRIAS